MGTTGAATVGFNCHAYYNAGSYSSPTWTEILPIKDLTLPQTDDDAESSSREGGGSKESEPGLRDNGVEYDMVYNQSDSAFAAHQTAYLARTTIELLVLDGLQSTSGSQGLRVTTKVSKFTRKEDLGGVVMTEVSAKPAKNANAAPAWYTAA